MTSIQSKYDDSCYDPRHGDLPRYQNYALFAFCSKCKRCVDKNQGSHCPCCGCQLRFKSKYVSPCKYTKYKTYKPKFIDSLPKN